jgi:50S ribosomal protein L16 3-hydroxylase
MLSDRAVSSEFGDWTSSIGCDRFFAEYWQRKVLALRLARSYLEQIAEEVGQLEVRRVAGLAQRGVQAWIASAQVSHSVLNVDASSGMDALSAGATLYFIDLPFAGLKQSLGRALGTRPQNIIASLFLSPKNGGADWHFDANENFTLQLTGSKRWFVAETPTVEAAPDHYILGRDVPYSMRDLLDLDKISVEPAQTIEMVQGSLLYVPRGFMHRTEADEESWSLNLSYERTMWVDLLCFGLRRRLALSEKWRGSVGGLGEAYPQSSRRANILPDIVQELRTMLDDPRELEKICQDFLNRTEPD